MQLNLFSNARNSFLIWLLSVVIGGLLPAVYITATDPTFNEFFGTLFWTYLYSAVYSAICFPALVIATLLVDELKTTVRNKRYLLMGTCAVLCVAVISYFLIDITADEEWWAIIPMYLFTTLGNCWFWTRSWEQEELHYIGLNQEGV